MTMKLGAVEVVMEEEHESVEWSHQSGNATPVETGRVGSMIFVCEISFLEELIWAYRSGGEPRYEKLHKFRSGNDRFHCSDG